MKKKSSTLVMGEICDRNEKEKNKKCVLFFEERRRHS
jgi:hypothetical protein